VPVVAKRLILLALACAFGVALLALLFYGSARFSNFDVRATSHLLAPTGSSRESIADNAADLANFGPLVVVLVAIVALGAIWKRPWHLLVAVAVYLLANATTQILKLTLAHPRLQGALGVDYPIEIHYPSGHTTAAVSAGFALWLIAPPKWRGWAALFAAVYGGAVGLGVIIAGWHFISDVIGAVLVVGFWASLALAAMVTAKMEEPADWLPREGQTTNPAK